jgi:YfiH family protein
MPKPLLDPGLANQTGIAHGYFTRHGGVSSGIYASLNCGIGSRDDPAAVRENRGRVTSHLGAGDLTSAYQVHGTAALVVSQPWPLDARPKADAMVTATPGMALGVLTADCAPVLLADAKARVIAAAHAGWRGALSGIVEAAITAMEGLGARRERISAAVGPCIGQGAYEVGPEFKAEFLDRDGDSADFFSPVNIHGRPHFDLSGYIVHRLRRAAVANAAALGVCTYAREEDFFSYRRTRSRQEPDYGRQISAIVLT